MCIYIYIHVVIGNAPTAETDDRCPKLLKK